MGVGWPGGPGASLGVAPRGLGLGWTALRRGARVLWIRLCRSTTRARSMGSTLGSESRPVLSGKTSGASATISAIRSNQLTA